MAPLSIDPQALAQSVYSILPEIVVIVTALFVLLLDATLPEDGKQVGS